MNSPFCILRLCLSQYVFAAFPAKSTTICGRTICALWSKCFYYQRTAARISYFFLNKQVQNALPISLRQFKYKFLIEFCVQVNYFVFPIYVPIKKPSRDAQCGRYVFSDIWRSMTPSLAFSVNGKMRNQFQFLNLIVCLNYRVLFRTAS